MLLLPYWLWKGPIQSKTQAGNFVMKPTPVMKAKALPEQVLRMVVKGYQPFVPFVEDDDFIKFAGMLNPSDSENPTRASFMV